MRTLSALALAGALVASAYSSAPERAGPRGSPESDVVVASARAPLSLRSNVMPSSEPPDSNESEQLTGLARPDRNATTIERQYLATRQLVEQGRFEEARDVARRMKQDYPNSPRAHELEKHLLVHPLGLPSREEQMANR